MNNERTKLERTDTYYVQTGEFKKCFEEINGRNDILFFDYMASPEFEISALPASTKRMLINIDFYDFFTYDEYRDEDGKALVVYAPVMFIDHIKSNLDAFARGKLKLAEKSLSLHDHIVYPEESPKCPLSNFWWDVQNDFYIFFGEERKDIILQAQNGIKKIYAGYKMIDESKINTGELAAYYLSENNDLSSEAIEFLNSKKSDMSRTLNPLK